MASTFVPGTANQTTTFWLTWGKSCKSWQRRVPQIWENRTTNVRFSDNLPFYWWIQSLWSIMNELNFTGRTKKIPKRSRKNRQNPWNTQSTLTQNGRLSRKKKDLRTITWKQRRSSSANQNQKYFQTLSQTVEPNQPSKNGSPWTWIRSQQREKSRPGWPAPPRSRGNRAIS